MSHFRSALHAGAYIVMLIATPLVLQQSVDEAAAASHGGFVDTARAVQSTATPDPEVERDLVSREKRASRSSARRAARPAPVAKRTVIEAITWTAPLTSYHLTSRFGDQSYMWSSGMHTGLDFAAPSGTPIRSIAEGTVTSASYDGSYGYKTVVTLPGGGEVWYCHQSRLGVRQGQHLEPGQVLGYVGATGNVTGEHLHMEIRRGGPVDPAAVLAAQGVHV